MQVLFLRPPLAFLALCALAIYAGNAVAQNPPASHVEIPNPTPRPPDLKDEYGKNPSQALTKEQTLMLHNQLRAREIWLESNQLLLLAQQLKDEVLNGKKSTPTAASAAKAGEIEKLAKTIQKNMRVQ